MEKSLGSHQLHILPRLYPRIPRLYPRRLAPATPPATAPAGPAKSPALAAFTKGAASFPPPSFAAVAPWKLGTEIQKWLLAISNFQEVQYAMKWHHFWPFEGYFRGKFPILGEFRANSKKARGPNCRTLQNVIFWRKVQTCSKVLRTSLNNVMLSCATWSILNSPTSQEIVYMCKYV